MLPKRRNALRNRLVASAILLGLTVLLAAAVRGVPSFTQSVYLPFSRTVSGWLGVLFSFTSYAAAEILLLLAGAGGLYALLRSIVRSVRARSARPLALWGSGVLLCAAAAAFAFMLLWGGAYSAEKAETRLGFQTDRHGEDVLHRATLRYMEDVIRYAALAPRNTDGKVDAGGFDALAPEAARTVKALMEQNPSLLGRAAAPPPKRALFYPIMGMLGISGIYSPFTGEAIVSTIGTDPFQPSVMTHEMAHRLGFAAEDDANFIAYLACMASENPVFRYSGALMAFSYCYNAMTDPGYIADIGAAMRADAADALEDYSRNRAEWDRYDGPLREAAETVNNTYLQAMGQEDGVKSYGRVVDLLIALYIYEHDNK